MGTPSKKETDMYGDVFGDLSSLASDDSGEINTFANDVINREVVSGNWKENIVEHLGDAWRYVRNRGDLDKIRAQQVFKKDQAAVKVLDAVDNGQYARVLRSPQVRHVFEGEIDNQAARIVDDLIKRTNKSQPDIAKAMSDQKDELIQDTKRLIDDAINKNRVVANNQDLIINVNNQVTTSIPGAPVIKVRQIKLNKVDFDRRIDDIKVQRTVDSKEFADVQQRIDARPKPQKGQLGKDNQGRVFRFNGIKWVLLAAGGIAAYQNLDKLPDIWNGFNNNNSTVDVGDASTSTDYSHASGEEYNGYDKSQSHDSPSSVMNNVNPGGSAPAQSSSPYGQDAWDKLKTTSPQRRKFESGDDDGWWNSSSGSRSTYDDMGYLGSSNESWSRVSQKSSPDELNDESLNDYGAEQLVAAQNFLSYYGLGSNKQPGEQIIPSLLMGNFDGMSFEDYKRTHSEEEVRQAMQRFEKGLSMFSEEMTKLANNLERFYEERQRRNEVHRPNQAIQTNEESQRTE